VNGFPDAKFQQTTLPFALLVQVDTVSEIKTPLPIIYT